LIQTSDIYTVFWLDLTKAGNAFEKVLPKMLRIIGDAAASKPRQVCAVVVAPLVGARGHGADADAADEAHDDCEVQIKMDIYKLILPAYHVLLRSLSQAHANVVRPCGMVPVLKHHGYDVLCPPFLV